MTMERQCSATIKGILMLLIILGHNHILCPTDESALMGYLYEFHVICFFILPCFYETKGTMTRSNVTDVVVRTWIPYFWLVLMCYMAKCAYDYDVNFSVRHIQAFITADKSSLKQFFGFVMPWYLPTFCSFSLWLAYARKYKIVYAGALLWGVMNLCLPWNEFFFERQVVPYGLALAVVYFTVAVATEWIYKIGEWTKCLGLVGFIVLSILYWRQVDMGYCSLLFPIVAFFAIWFIAPFIGNFVFRLLGKYSLGIYVVHLFVSRIIEMAVPHTFLWGIVDLVLTTGISTGIVVAIYRVKWLRIWLFPRSMSEIRQLFQR